MTKTRKLPRAPQHLSKKARKWWNEIVFNFEFEAHDLATLTMAGEAMDRCEEARLRIAQDGAYITGGRYGLKSHPAVNVERDNRILFARLIRELALNVEAPESRMPGIRR